ncbi:MAG TPA: DUF3891 family protein [Solirubrobacteraceae bacterium]|nr:DUF3891 family protein [Solirubrobacteraceae bacterium]
MLLREDDRGVLAIGQPSHAWVSGQLARAWGNEQFGGVEPLAEVCLGADQHDVGWMELDIDPAYNPETGLPYSFMETPLDAHLRLWNEGTRRLLSQSRYATWLVSRHGSRLYERRDLSKLSAEDADAVRRFLDEQRALRQELAVSLGANEEQLERNSRLIWTWDYLSLALCLDWDPATARGAPSADGQVDITVESAPGGRVHLDPWPLADPELTVRAEGRRLAGPFESEQEMRRSFAAAPWEMLELRLEPKRDP